MCWVFGMPINKNHCVSITCYSFSRLTISLAIVARRTGCIILSFPCLALLCLSMANPAEQYQVEIGEIFDHFLDLMWTSSARVDIESQRFQGYCQVKLTLWKCGSCPHPLFATFFAVRESCDLGHLPQYLDLIQNKWRLYSNTEDSD